jgi:hypothetical protein
MPAVVVLVVCKTIISGPPDQNAGYTGYEPREWATEHSMMICRRLEIDVMDQAEAMGADPQPFNQQRCQRSGALLGVEWDQAHRSSSYRHWRYACPVPIVNTITKEIIGWKKPECGHRDTVRCEVDAEI